MNTDLSFSVNVGQGHANLREQAFFAADRLVPVSQNHQANRTVGIGLYP